MRQDSAAGMALLASVLGMVITMIFHPTGHEVIHRAGAMHRGVAVHALALITVPLALFGFLIFTQRLRRLPNMPILAFIVYACGRVALIGAVVASGFLATAVAARLHQGVGMRQEALRAVLFYTGSMNQAFAKIHVLADSVAIILWSLSIWRVRRWLAAVGILIGVATLAAVAPGYLTLDVHGAGAVVFAHGLWTAWVAVLLLRGVFVNSQQS